MNEKIFNPLSQGIGLGELSEFLRKKFAVGNTALGFNYYNWNL